MRFVMGGRVIEIESIDAALDDVFVDLHASYLGRDAFTLTRLEQTSAPFFASTSGRADLHDKYFNNFTVIWQNLLSAGNYDEAERVWDLALTPALAWEAANPGKFIHKGTAYYFWAMTAVLRGDLDKGYVLMHRGVKEDIRTTGQQIPDTPGYAFASLNFGKVGQAFLAWVLDQARYLDKRLTNYRAVYGRALTLNEFKARFLQGPPNADVTFLFAHTVARLMKLSAVPKDTLQTQFAAQIEANLLFDIALVIDAAIRAKNPTKGTFIDNAGHISVAAGAPLTIKQLQEINTAFVTGFDNTLAALGSGGFSFLLAGQPLPGSRPMLPSPTVYETRPLTTCPPYQRSPATSRKSSKQY